MDVLRLGSKGPEVTTWQNFLTNRKIPTKADGVFGPQTKINTGTWQIRAGVPVSGEVDDQTLKYALNLGLTSSTLSSLITSKTVTVPAQSELDLFPKDWENMTKVNAAKLSKICPAVAARVIRFIMAAANDGVVLQIVQGLRTFSEQDALYAQGRTKPGKIVTNARGGQSLHNYGIAADLAVVKNGAIDWNDRDYVQFNKWDDIAGLEWGGNWRTFKDLPHVQDTEGMNLARVQQLYREGGLARVWANVK